METPVDVMKLFLESDGARALATVVGVNGSSPGKSGFKMLVFEDGGARGTVGGGSMEKLVIEDAISAMRAGKPSLKEYLLTEKESGMWCGGKVTVFIEPFPTTGTVWIFGYGHIGSEVYKLLSSLGYKPEVVDDKPPEGASHREFDWERLSPLPDVTKDDYVLLLTLDAKKEVEIIAKLAPLSAKYIGIVGSRRKGTKLKKKLGELGVETDALNLHIPVGVPINARTAGEIAVSIVAELIKEKNAG